MAKKIKAPLIELLAIKLYEHDHQDGYWPPKPGWSMTSWMKLAEEDRELYRKIASGREPLPGA